MSGPKLAVRRRDLEVGRLAARVRLEGPTLEAERLVDREVRQTLERGAGLPGDRASRIRGEEVVLVLAEGRDGLGVVSR
jgi:hypothetical protein